MPTPVVAIHVEDSDLDAELFEYYVHTLNIPVNIVRLRDGQEAIDFFRNEAQHQSAERSLLVLDLGLPKISGHGVLKCLRDLKNYEGSLKIVVLSGSSNPRDREECQNLGAQDYFIKPFGLTEYENLIKGPIQTLLRTL